MATIIEQLYTKQGGRPVRFKDIDRSKLYNRRRVVHRDGSRRYRYHLYDSGDKGHPYQPPPHLDGGHYKKVQIGFPLPTEDGRLKRGKLAHLLHEEWGEGRYQVFDLGGPPGRQNRFIGWLERVE